MSTVITDLYNQLQEFSHLQKLHSVLSADLRSCRERVLKETRGVRRELTFYRWCQRRDLNSAYPFPRGSSFINKGLDYDRLLFYRKLICYLHDHPLEFSQIIVSLPMIKTTPSLDSLESLYFDRERDLAECIAFDVMMTDINALTLLLRSILLNSKTATLNTLSQKLFQLFIVIVCHKLIHTTFRSLLNRLYKINEKLSFQKSRGSVSEMSSSILYRACDDVLSVMISFLRILPIPLRHCISIMTEEKMITSASSLLEWLLSRIFSPLLLQPDDWYLVICNPAKDESTNNNNIQSIVTTLLQLCRAFQTHTEHTVDTDDEVELTHLLLLKHGETLSSLLNILLRNVMDSAQIEPSSALVPSNGSPELFILHRILILLSKHDDNSNIMSNDLISLCSRCSPPHNIAFRPWITIQLPTINFVMNEGNMIVASDDSQLSGSPSSSHLSSFVFKPIRVFLLSLSAAQSLSIPLSIFECFNTKLVRDLNLSIQQVTLLNEIQTRIKTKCGAIDLSHVFALIVSEYRDTFCRNLLSALSTHNVVSSLNYIQNREITLRELRGIFIESHENLQIRDILYLSKQNIPQLRLQMEKIQYSLPTTVLTGQDEYSDWQNDKFVVFRSTKCISKTRNALIRFLNDYGIGRVDFKLKFGGSVLDFCDKRISRVLVNAIIFEIRDIFWNRCLIEDAKFEFQCIQLNDEFGADLNAFFCAFLKTQNIEKLPKLSDKTLKMMVNGLSQINSESECQSIADFEDCIATLRDALITCINGADCADGDDYMPLFCYILMKCLPKYLPSQLQNTKVISQRKVQDKCFIDCCVAMKALRNFCNVSFQDNSNNERENINSNQIETMENELEENTPKVLITKSIFESIKAKLPQNINSNSNSNSNQKKGFFNLSPSNSFSQFINKTTQNDEERKENKNTDADADDDADIMVEVKTKI